MASIEALKAATEEELGREIIRLVPHWYEAECGPEAFSIPVGGYAAQFFNQVPLSRNLAAFHATICKHTQELPVERMLEYPGVVDILLERFASEWLRMHCADTDWVRVINYLETVARRTHENLPVALTLLIRRDTGREDITLPHLQKFFDRLAASPYTFTYLAVDPDMQLIDYGSLEWSQVNNAQSYRFYPEFLHPIHSVMSETDLVAHLTPRGDLILMNRFGVMATKRKRKWMIYDAANYEHALASCLGNRDVAANLLEVLFDLSFRRQGALLVFDPEHQLLERILNPESILAPIGQRNGHASRARTPGQAVIAGSIEHIAIGAPAGSLKKKRQLIEMASIDGAVVFDADHLLAVGALVRSHPAVGNQLGARATAARSAYLWGAYPIQVSSDGDVTVHFKSVGGGTECDAELNLL